MRFSNRGEARMLWRKNGQGINQKKVGRGADNGEGYLRLFCDPKKIKIPGALISHTRNDVYCEKLNFMRWEKNILFFEKENKGRLEALPLF